MQYLESNNRMTMNRYLLCLILPALVTIMPASAQTKRDSLIQALAKVSSDSLRIRLLLELSDQYQYENVDQANTYANQALELSEEKNWEWALAESNLRMAFLGTLMGDFTTALKFDNRYLQAARNLNDSLLLARAMNNIGQDYSDLGEYDDAYYYLTKSYRVARAIDDSLFQSVCLLNLGHVFRELGQYDIAL